MIVLHKYLAVAGLSIAVLLLILKPLMRLAEKLGFVDYPGGRRTHEKPTPLSGGVAIFTATHLAAAVVYLFHWDMYSGHIGVTEWLWLLACSSLVLLLGLYDDRLDLSARWKLAGQILIASVVYAGGTTFGKMLYVALPAPLDYIATVLWLVGAMNAFNLIDGMDGLATGLGLIGAAGLGLLSIFTHNLSDALLMVALAGSCLAFLRYNFHPARVFLGDSGSMFIGFTLAWFSLETSTKAPAVMTLLVPLLAMGIPLLDTFLALWRRFARHLLNGETGSGLFTADREHLHDRLRGAGMSQRRAAVILYVLASFLVVAGLAATMYSSYRVGILAATFAIFSYVVIRHLSRVELWESGRLAVRGLHSPAPKVVAVIVYPLVDIIILSLSLYIVIMLMGGRLGDGNTKDIWLGLAPVSVGVPFICIVCSKAYRRVWSRASIAEYGVLILWFVIGILLCGAVYELGRNGLSHSSIISCQLMFIGVALPAIIMVRVFLRMLKDLMMMLNRHRSADDASPATVIYGAGYLATVFIRQYGYADVSDYDRYRIIGFVDDDRNLRGRIVYGVKVLGTLDDFEQIAAGKHIVNMIVTQSVNDDVREKLGEISERCGIRVLYWKSELID